MNKEENIETIFFDESGTPAVLRGDGLFVAGGFAIRGDTNLILDKWKKFLEEKNLHGKKGRKYSTEEFLDLSYFMCKYSIIPLTSHSYLNEDDLYFIRKKISNYKNIADKLRSKSPIIKENKYLWALHIAVTIATSILSLIINRGETSKILISVDKYLSDRQLQNIIDQVVTNFFEPHKLNDFLKTSLGKYERHPNAIMLFSNFKPDYKFISLDWNARGKFKLLADAVCAMYRRALQRDSGAKKAWDVIKICFRKNGKIPICIGNDITKYIREGIREPWLIPRITS